jgi:hypothetical protein
MGVKSGATTFNKLITGPFNSEKCRDRHREREMMMRRDSLVEIPRVRLIETFVSAVIERKETKGEAAFIPTDTG